MLSPETPCPSAALKFQQVSDNATVFMNVQSGQGVRFVRFGARRGEHFDSLAARWRGNSRVKGDQA
jgi:hypothetical protein